jgi:pimeloyl-ACP methyl ester carboxylesterase
MESSPMRKTWPRVAILAISVIVAALPLGALETPPGTIVGGWSGVLDVGGTRLPLVFHIDQNEAGLSATMDSPAQGAKGIPASAASFADGTLRIEFKSMRAVYAGKLSADGSAIAGTWIQGSSSLRLDLVRSASAGDSRPQTPKPPYPYRSEELKFQGGAPGVELAATLFIPAGKGPFPAVVLVTGSGPQDRDETILGHRPFLVIADHLARNGIAVLRYDDRGVASSTGDFGSATTLDFAADAMAALDYLAARPETDPRRVGIVGHSEGGLIAPLVASKDPKARFIVLLSGPAMRGSDLLLLQTAAIARASGLPAEAIAGTQAINAKLYAIASGPGDQAKIAAELKRTYLEWVDAEPSLKPAERDEARKGADSAVASLVAPWTRCFLSLDPAPALASLSIPVLALGGTKDLQVPEEENFRAFARIFADSGRSSLLTLRKLDGLNHLFQHATMGLPNEYGLIEETFAPEALGAMTEWILGR